MQQATVTPSRPWMFCGAMGGLALVFLLVGVGLLFWVKDVHWLVGAFSIGAGVPFAILTADFFLTPPFTTAQLERAEQAIANLRRDLVALQPTFQQLGEKLPSLTNTIEKLDTDAVARYRALLKETDNTLSEKFKGVRRDIADSIEGVRMDVTRNTGVLQGVMEAEMKRRQQEHDTQRSLIEDLKSAVRLPPGTPQP